MSSPDKFACHIADGRCGSYGCGHNTHAIHAKHVGRTPWGWRDGVVAEICDRWLHVDYLGNGARVRVWHHRALAGEVVEGQPVRVHEQYHVLGGPFGWLNINLEGGSGPVPAPADPSTWAGQITGGVADLATGRGIALDWLTNESL